jgi:hypothetical protein
VAKNQRFVQVLHNYDHWVCITNVFSTDVNDIFVYDSTYCTVARSTIIQTASLLRLAADDYVQFHIRRFQQQTIRTRLCGLYAVAAAIACCYGVDVSGNLYDENVLVNHLAANLSSKKAELVPCVETDTDLEIKVSKIPLLYCVCQGRRTVDMIVCIVCGTPFHTECVGSPIQTGKFYNAVPTVVTVKDSDSLLHIHCYCMWYTQVLGIFWHRIKFSFESPFQFFGHYISLL